MARNQQQCRIWFGNLAPGTTTKDVQDFLAIHCNNVRDVHKTPNKDHGYIVFGSTAAAEVAMRRLQGKQLHGHHMLLRAWRVSINR